MDLPLLDGVADLDPPPAVADGPIGPLDLGAVLESTLARADRHRKPLPGTKLDFHDARAAIEDAHRIARQRYGAGLSRYLDVLAAEDKLVAARRRVADLEAQAFALDVALVRALGGGFAEHS